MVFLRTALQHSGLAARAQTLCCSLSSPEASQQEGEQLPGAKASKGAKKRAREEREQAIERAEQARCVLPLSVVLG